MEGNRHALAIEIDPPNQQLQDPGLTRRHYGATESSQLLQLMEAIDAVGAKPGLIVLDTLARCFGGGDENSTQDMSRFVSACDAIRP